MEWLKQFARLFGWRNKQYETLTEAMCHGWKVRVWRAEDARAVSSMFAGSETNKDVLAIVEQCRREIGPAHAYETLFARLLKLPRVACVAIVDANGNGVSAYPDWH